MPFFSFSILRVGPEQIWYEADCSLPVAPFIYPMSHWQQAGRTCIYHCKTSIEILYDLPIITNIPIPTSFMIEDLVWHCKSEISLCRKLNPNELSLQMATRGCQETNWIIVMLFQAFSVSMSFSVCIMYFIIQYFYIAFLWYKQFLIKYYNVTTMSSLLHK